MNDVAQWVSDRISDETNHVIPIEADDDAFAFVDWEALEVYLVTVKRAKFVPVEGE